MKTVRGSTTYEGLLGLLSQPGFYTIKGWESTTILWVGQKSVKVIQNFPVMTFWFAWQGELKDFLKECSRSRGSYSPRKIQGALLTLKASKHLTHEEARAAIEFPEE